MILSINCSYDVNVKKKMLQNKAQYTPFWDIVGVMISFFIIFYKLNYKLNEAEWM